MRLPRHFMWSHAVLLYIQNVVDYKLQNPKHIKIVVIGPAGCGKTSLMLRYTQGDFDILKTPSVCTLCNY